MIGLKKLKAKGSKKMAQNNNQHTIRNVVAIGIGAAIFFILNRFATIPSGIPNTNITVSYPFLALLGIIFGPVVAGVSGLIGHILTDMTYGGIWWSWVVSTAIAGVLYGFLGKQIAIAKKGFGGKEIIIFIVGVIVINYIVWGLIAPLGDILIYAEPASKVFTQGLVSGTSNGVSTAIIGVILLKVYASAQVKKGSLRKED